MVVVLCRAVQLFCFNNSAWGWESGLQTESLLYRNDIGCCVVLGGEGSVLTTRPVSGRVGFRRKVCCIGTIWVAVLCWVGAGFLFNNSAWGWESGLQREGLFYRNDMGCCDVWGWAVSN